MVSKVSTILDKIPNDEEKPKPHNLEHIKIEHLAKTKHLLQLRLVLFLEHWDPLLIFRFFHLLQKVQQLCFLHIILNRLQFAELQIHFQFFLCQLLQCLVFLFRFNKCLKQ